MITIDKSKPLVVLEYQPGYRFAMRTDEPFQGFNDYYLTYKDDGVPKEARVLGYANDMDEAVKIMQESPRTDPITQGD